MSKRVHSVIETDHSKLVTTGEKIPGLSEIFTTNDYLTIVHQLISEIEAYKSAVSNYKIAASTHKTKFSSQQTSTKTNKKQKERQKEKEKESKKTLEMILQQIHQFLINMQTYLNKLQMSRLQPLLNEVNLKMKTKNPKSLEDLLIKDNILDIIDEKELIKTPQGLVYGSNYINFLRKTALNHINNDLEEMLYVYNDLLGFVEEIIMQTKLKYNIIRSSLFTKYDNNGTWYNKNDQTYEQMFFDESYWDKMDKQKNEKLKLIFGANENNKEPSINDLLKPFNKVKRKNKSTNEKIKEKENKMIRKQKRLVQYESCKKYRAYNIDHDEIGNILHSFVKNPPVDPEKSGKKQKQKET